jgi:hypothetical protein
LAGDRYQVMAEKSGMSLDDMLGVHMRVLTFGLQTIVEQAVAQLERLLLSQGRALADAVVQFPEHLRFGVPTAGARLFSTVGVRHRSAAVALGSDGMFRAGGITDRVILRAEGRRLLAEHPGEWRERLGELVYRNTLQDLS